MIDFELTVESASKNPFTIVGFSGGNFFEMTHLAEKVESIRM